MSSSDEHEDTKRDFLLFFAIRFTYGRRNRRGEEEGDEKSLRMRPVNLKHEESHQNI